MRHDYYLMFNDEAEAKTVLADYLDEDGNWQSYTTRTFTQGEGDDEQTIKHRIDVDIIGTYTKTTLNEGGDPDNPDDYTVVTYEGWYVNVYSCDYEMPELLEYDQAPNTPWRVAA